MIYSDAKLPRSRDESFLAVIAVWSIALFFAFLGGLASTTESPILIGLFVGSVAGTLLLSRLDIAVWIVLAGALIIGGLTLQFMPSLGKISWLFSMVGFLLYGGAVFHFFGKPSIGREVPWFAWLAILFPFYAMLMTVLQGPSPAEVMAGFKRYFQFYGLLAVLALVRFPTRFYTQILRFIIICGLIQVVFAAFQLVFVVPQRVGMGHGVVPIDAVTGTFESTLEGGGASSVMATFVLVIFTFILSAWRDKVLSGRRALYLSLLVLPPLVLGETKIVVIFLPIAVFVAVRRDIAKNPFTGFLIISFGLAATAALGYLYLVISTVGNTSLETTFDKIIGYNFGNVGYHSLSGLNRSTAVSFWWDQQSWSDPIRFVFGHGLGASYSGGGSLVPGHLSSKYGSLAIGFTGLTTLLWDTGILGTFLFLLIFFGAWRSAHRSANLLPPGIPRTLAVTAEAGIIMNAVLIPYSSSIVSLPSHEVFFLLLLAATVLSAHPMFQNISPPREQATR